MATIWKGAVTFGLVNIPVRAEPATRETEKVSFRQLDRSNRAPIKMKRVNAVTGEEVAWADIVKGYAFAKDRFVVIEPQELERLKVPTGRALELIAFVDAGEIDPRHYETPYFLVPEATAGRAYALLREAIRDSGVVGVGRVTMRQRTHVVTVRVLEDALVMDVIRPASELVDPHGLALPSGEGVRAPEKAMAAQLIEHLRAPFDTSEFTDEYEEAVRALVEAKLGGQKLAAGDAEADLEGTPVIDLMARLEESLARAGTAGKRSAPDRGSRRSARPVAEDESNDAEAAPSRGRATARRGAGKAAAASAKRGAGRGGRPAGGDDAPAPRRRSA